MSLTADADALDAQYEGRAEGYTYAREGHPNWSILADKLDLTEEVVRLRAHLDAAATTLDGTVPAGKRLGFLGQEMLREINTIGSKANDATIAHTVVDMKGELEKFREQIENLE